MNPKKALNTRHDWRAALIALSTLILAGTGSAAAQSTKPTDPQTRPDSPSQVKSSTASGQNTSTFTPKPSNPSAPTGNNKTNTEK